MREFEIVGTTLKLRAGQSLDREVEPSVSLNITVTDQGGTGLTYNEAFTITVGNVNEAPTDITLDNITVAENADGASVGNLSVVDPDSGDSHAWAVDDVRFEIVGTTLKLQAGESLDRELEPSVSLNITVTDQGGTGLTYNEAFTISVDDVNEAPTDITLDNTTVSENAGGAAIGNLGVVDPDSGDTHTWAVDDVRFEIVGTTLKLQAGQSLDYESEPTVSLTITATDQGGTGQAYNENFTIIVNDVNESPVDITLSNNQVIEKTAGAFVGVLGVIDPDSGDTHTWSVDDPRFEIVGGTLRLKADASLDRLAEPTVNIIVTVTDQTGTGLTYDESFVIVAIPSSSPIATILNPPDLDIAEPDRELEPEPHDLDDSKEPTEVDGSDTGLGAVIPDSADREESRTSASSTSEESDQLQDLAPVIPFANAVVEVSVSTGGSDSHSERTAPKKPELPNDAIANEIHYVVSDRMMQTFDQLQDEVDHEDLYYRTVTNSTFAAATSLSVGYVIWLIRGGVLLSSVLSSLPAWQAIDPLPILAFNDENDQTDHDDSLESLVTKSPQDSSLSEKP